MLKDRQPRSPSVNADGTRIAYTEHQPRSTDVSYPYSIIKVAFIDHDPVTCFSLVEDIPLTPESQGVHGRQPSISSDGQWVAYTSDVDGDYEIFVARADGTEEPVQITFDDGLPEGFITDRNPSLCGDGSVLAWITSAFRDSINDPLAVVRRLDAGGGYGDIAVIESSDITKSGPVVSDDCGSIVFAGSLVHGGAIGPGGQEGLHVVLSDGADARMLVEAPLYFASMSRGALLIPFVRIRPPASLELTTWYGTEPRLLIPGWADPWPQRPLILSCAKQEPLEYPYAPYFPSKEPLFPTPLPLCEYATAAAGERIFFLGRDLVNWADNVFSVPNNWDPYDPDRLHELWQLTFNR